MSEAQTWLVAFGEIDGLRWVLKHSRMAFSEGLAWRASRIRPGDQLVLYATRGAFHNPTRDRSQLAGLARATSPVRRLRRPVQIRGRDYVVACDIQVTVSLPERQGVDFAPFVRKLEFIRRKNVWGQYLRAGLVPISRDDGRFLEREVRKAAR